LKSSVSRFKITIVDRILAIGWNNCQQKQCQNSLKKPEIAEIQHSCHF
jgi:hypothetical protein